MLQNDLHPGDVLLFRPSGWIGKIVAFCTKSKYCHAAMYIGEGNVAEMREFRGGRILPLSEYAGESIDVFRADAPVVVKIDAVLTMQALLSERYSFWHCVEAFLLRRLPKFVRKKECDHHGYHCSQAVSKAYRSAGLDLCPGVADWATTPGDLAVSKRLKYAGPLGF
jgi:hypothetical protein